MKLVIKSPDALFKNLAMGDWFVVGTELYIRTNIAGSGNATRIDRLSATGYVMFREDAKVRLVKEVNISLD